jgi:hypothetical protein
MLAHLQAILQLRRERELLVEGRHVAEALALRGDFDGLRNHPRFEALIERVTEEMRRQRESLNA